MRDKSLGEQALAVLRYISEQGGATVGEVAAGFGDPQGLSRSTVVTVMDRLRLQGYLTRFKQEDGVFRYLPEQKQEELFGWLITRFIDKALAVDARIEHMAERSLELLSDETRQTLMQLLSRRRGPASV